MRWCLIAKVKCPHCGQFFDRTTEECVYYKRRYYHKSCYEEAIPQEELDKDSLFEYVKQVYNAERVSPAVYTQAKRFHENAGYSYSGMEKAFRYFIEIKKGKPGIDQNLGILPYIWEEAKNYYYQLWLIENQNSQPLETPVIEITIRQPVKKPEKVVKELSMSLAARGEE